MNARTIGNFKKLPLYRPFDTLLNMFSLSWFGIVLLTLLYASQHLRPQNILGVEKFPLFSIISVSLFFVLALHEGIRKVKLHVQMRWIGLLLLLLAIQTYMTDYQGRAFEIYTTLLQQFYFVIGVLALVDSIQKFKVLVNAISINIILLVVYAFATQPKFGRYQMFDTLSNFLVDPNELSLFLNLMIPWVMLSFMDAKRKMTKAFYGLGVVLTCALSLLTYSRGSFLGFTVMLFFTVILHPKRVQYSILIVVLAIAMIPLLGDSWLDLMSSATDSQSKTAQTRITMWIAAWELFTINPLGNGPGTIPVMAFEVISDNVLGIHHLHWYGDVAHSFWFTALAEWGIVGFGILLYLVYLNLADAVRLLILPKHNDDFCYLKAVGATILASMSGFLLSASFLTVNYYPHFWYVTSLICSASFISYIMQREKNNERLG